MRLLSAVKQETCTDLSGSASVAMVACRADMAKLWSWESWNVAVKSKPVSSQIANTTSQNRSCANSYIQAAKFIPMNLAATSTCQTVTSTRSSITWKAMLRRTSTLTELKTSGVC